MSKTKEKGEWSHMLKMFISTIIFMELGMMFFKFTKVGRLLSLILKITYKLTREVLGINYKFIKVIYKMINKKHKQSKVRHQNELRKAVGCENIIDLSKYKSRSTNNKKRM